MKYLFIALLLLFPINNSFSETLQDKINNDELTTGNRLHDTFEKAQENILKYMRDIQGTDFSGTGRYFNSYIFGDKIIIELQVKSDIETLYSNDKIVYNINCTYPKDIHNPIVAKLIDVDFGALVNFTIKLPIPDYVQFYGRHADSNIYIMPLEECQISPK